MARIEMRLKVTFAWWFRPAICVLVIAQYVGVPVSDRLIRHLTNAGVRLCS